MGSVVAKRIRVYPGQNEYRVSFDRQIPLGVVRSARLQTVEFVGEEPPVLAVKKIEGRTVHLYASVDSEAEVEVEASSEAPYNKRFDYIVR